MSMILLIKIEQYLEEEGAIKLKDKVGVRNYENNY
ncbi:hypothetical protein HMPREF1210_00140 [Paenisporosarcina sp. HGH0030]|nr:hypothetical protein HMPREF1210_00140 [Paenisporosarcina sp. HGH0030]